MKLSSCLFLILAAAPMLVAQTKFATDLLGMNPLGFWPLNGNANDATTHGNNGTLMNGTGFSGSVGPLGPAATPAAVFTSTLSNFIQMPTAGSSIFSFSASHPFTAMAWVRTLGVRHMAIISKADVVGGNGWSFSVDSGGGHFALLFVSGGNAAGGAESAVPVNDGNWHFVAATYDGSGSATSIQLYLDGVVVPLDTFSAPGSTSILNSAPLTIGAEPDASDAFEGYINDAAVFGTAVTAGQIQALLEDAPGFQSVLPQFAFGGGWYSAVYFTNTGTTAATFPVNFTADSGNPLPIPSLNGAATIITLPAGATTIIEAPNVGQLVQGYVTAALPPGVSGYGLFRQSVPGIADQEGVAAFSPTTSVSNTLLYDETSYVTAVAIVNPTAFVAIVAIKAVDIHGNIVGTGTINLPPGNKTEAVLESIAGLKGVIGNRGTVLFAVPTGSVSVLGIRFNGSAFTQIPAIGPPGM